MVFTVSLQLAVLVLVGVYVAVMITGQAHSAVWAAPAVGAVVGTALPLQVVVAVLLRNLR